MSETNDKAIAVATKQLGLQETFAKLLTPTQIGWLMLEKNKRDLFTNLQNNELVIQGFLNNFEQEVDLDKAQERIKQAKASLAELKQRRLDFSRVVKEKITDPAMAFEKRCEPLFDLAEKHELQLRKKAEAEAWEAGALLREEQAFTAHFTNEQYRIAAEYRTGLDKLLLYFYMKAIEDKVPASNMKQYKQTVATELATLKLEKPKQFSRVKITEARAKELYNEVRKYNPASDLQEYQTNKLNDTFAMYAQDLKNAEAAIAKAKEEQREKETRTNELLQIEIGTNNLMAKATPVELIDAPKVKRSVKIVVENTDAWAMAVLTCFISFWAAVKPYVKVKSIENLKIGQMAEALSFAFNNGDIDELPPTLNLQEVEK